MTDGLRRYPTHRRCVRTLITLSLVVLAPSLFGQGNLQLHGQVFDETGAVISGALVTLVTGDGQKRTAAANGNGEFTIANVPSGTYSLSVEAKGFESYIESALTVSATSSPLKIILAVAKVEAEIDVKPDTSGVSVEPDQNMNGTVLDEQFIQTLPDNEDDLRAFLQGLAGPAAGGVSGGQGGAQIYVDGFPGGHLPPREAILQIRINQNPFSAEYATPGIGRIEIITKPGSDQWHGTFGTSFRNSTLDARNAFADLKPDLDQKRFSLSLSGPIISKRMSFFLNAERRDLNGSSTINAETLDGPFTANVPASNETTLFSLRTDYLINPRNTFNVGYTYRRTVLDNREFAIQFGGLGGGGGTGGNNFTLPERGSNSENTNQTMILAENFVINSRLVHETHLRYQHEITSAQADTQGVAINVLDAFNGGGSTCCPSKLQQDQLDWQNYLTFTYKKHTLKGGFQLAYENDRDLSAANFNGAFTFTSLDQYRSVLNGDHTDPNDPSSPLVTPTQFTINRGNPFVRYNQYEASWFIQDDWRLRPNFTLSLGLRHEFQSHLDDKLNFAPRLGIAWSPLRDRKMTVRAGGGIFFSRLTGGLFENTLRFDGVNEQSIIIRNPLFPDPFAGTPVIDPGKTITDTLAPDLKAPYVVNFTTSVERQLPQGLLTSITYIYARGVHQFRTRNINAPLPGTVVAGIADSGIHPFGDVGNIYELESTANSIFHGVMFRLDRRFGRSFTFFSSYTLSWTRNDADGPGALPADNYNLGPEWGPALTDRRNHLFIGGNVNLPHGFRLTPFIIAASGGPFDITTGSDDNGDDVINDRPPGVNRNSDLPASLYPLIPDRCIANCLLGETPVMLREYLMTNFPNGIHAVGPGLFNVNLGISKIFGFGHRDNQGSNGQQGGQDRPRGGGGGRRGGGGGGAFGGFGADAGQGRGGLGGGAVAESSRFNIQLSAQISNIFNQVNLGQFSGVLSSPFFDRANGAGPARQYELNLRFSF